MLILDSSHSLTCTLNAAKTTTDMDFVISYADSTSTTFAEGTTDGTTNGTTEVAMLAAPGASTNRVIKYIIITNVDTATKTVTIKTKAGATYRTIIVSDIAPNDSLIMDTTGNWKIYSNSYQEYGFLTLSADQTTNISVGNPVKFNTIDGNLQFNTGTYIATLRAGITYLLEAHLTASFSGATGYISWNWYDITNVAILGKMGLSYAMTMASHAGLNTSSGAIVTPVTDITVDCRIVAGAAFTTFHSLYSYAMIKSLT